MVRTARWDEVRHLVRASYKEQEIGTSPSPAHGYLAYEEDGKVVACQGWRNIGWLYAELCHLYVMPSHRNKGIAKKLVREVINRLSAKVILSTVLENNKVSQVVLKKCGFKAVGKCSSPISGRTLMVFAYVKTE
ncbi:GNAT family N-acetyltransferase [Thermocrinis sp.]|jgi:RimJ/RimL family protein N-acetyltransferase|uniref:GNAT family N-acetyltransferase n=1 Tax=Thermocrinis sp. TaxID=2024383 RepID=UPI003C11D42B